MKISRIFESFSEKETTSIPAGRMERLRQSFRRRISDDLLDVFNRACAENDRRTAAGLFAVLEDLQRRRQQAHGYERRISEEALDKARTALTLCRARTEQHTKEAA